MGQGRNGNHLLGFGLRDARAAESFGIFLLDEGSRDVAGDEFRVIHHGLQEGDVMTDPLQLEPVERRAHPGDGRLARRCPGAELGNHRIVIH